jgi:parvulin-like peptidyl-prolyl isomerase
MLRMITASTSRLLLPGLLLLSLTAACRPAPAPAPAAVSADTWAVVNGRNIARDEVEKAFRRAANEPSALSPEETLQAKLTVLDELIVRDLLLAKATDLKVELPDSELDAAYLEARKNVPDDQFQQQLAQRNLTPGDMREALRRELLTRKVIEREVTAKVQVTDQEISTFFEANKASFNVPEDSWRLAQIVITPVREQQVPNRSGSDATTPQQAQEKAQIIMARLKGGQSFQELAAEFSEDPQTAGRGGDLGLVPLSALKQAPAALREAVMKAEPGTARLVTLGGVHTVVLIVGREAAGQRDLTMPEVKQQITDLLRGRREQVLRTAYLANLRSDAKVVNHLAQRVVQAQGKVPDGMATTPVAAK